MCVEKVGDLQVEIDRIQEHITNLYTDKNKPGVTSSSLKLINREIVSSNLISRMNIRRVLRNTAREFYPTTHCSLSNFYCTYAWRFAMRSNLQKVKCDLSLAVQEVWAISLLAALFDYSYTLQVT